MKTNDLRKGDRVRLRNGWEATIEDNRKGNTRLATVEGYVTETGSVYAHDIVEVIELRVYSDPRPLVPVNTKIEHTPAQIKLKDHVETTF